MRLADGDTLVYGMQLVDEGYNRPTPDYYRRVVRYDLNWRARFVFDFRFASSSIAPYLRSPQDVLLEVLPNGELLVVESDAIAVVLDGQTGAQKRRWSFADVPMLGAPMAPWGPECLGPKRALPSTTAHLVIDLSRSDCGRRTRYPADLFPPGGPLLRQAIADSTDHSLILASASRVWRINAEAQLTLVWADGHLGTPRNWLVDLRADSSQIQFIRDFPTRELVRVTSTGRAQVFAIGGTYVQGHEQCSLSNPDSPTLCVMEGQLSVLSPAGVVLAQQPVLANSSEMASHMLFPHHAGVTYVPAVEPNGGLRLHRVQGASFLPPLDSPALSMEGGAGPFTQVADKFYFSSVNPGRLRQLDPLTGLIRELSRCPAREASPIVASKRFAAQLYAQSNYSVRTYHVCRVDLQTGAALPDLTLPGWFLPSGGASLAIDDEGRVAIAGRANNSPMLLGIGVDGRISWKQDGVYLLASAGARLIARDIEANVLGIDFTSGARTPITRAPHGLFPLVASDPQSGLWVLATPGYAYNPIQSASVLGLCGESRAVGPITFGTGNPYVEIHDAWPDGEGGLLVGYFQGSLEPYALFGRSLYVTCNGLQWERAGGPGVVGVIVGRSVDGSFLNYSDGSQFAAVHRHTRARGDYLGSHILWAGSATERATFAGASGRTTSVHSLGSAGIVLRQRTIGALSGDSHLRRIRLPEIAAVGDLQLGGVSAATSVTITLANTSETMVRAVLTSAAYQMGELRGLTCMQPILSYRSMADQLFEWQIDLPPNSQTFCSAALGTPSPSLVPSATFLLRGPYDLLETNISNNVVLYSSQP